MFRRAIRPATLRLGIATLVLCCTVAGCKRAERAPAPAPAPGVPAPVSQVQSKDQAMAALLALPELQAWSRQIERRSNGKARGAVIEDDPVPRDINGKKYYQLSFVENREQDVRRRESFLVAQEGGEILVDDLDSDNLLSLQEWRRTIERVDLR